MTLGSGRAIKDVCILLQEALCKQFKHLFELEPHDASI